MRALRRFRLTVVGALTAAGVAVTLVATMSAGGSRAPAQGPASWRGLVGEPRTAVPTSGRMIVLLTTPSVAQRLAQVHYATELQERAWAAQAFAAQQQVLTTLAAEGITVHPDYSYSRVVDGFAALLDPRAVALLDAMPEVAGVYPVRATYPASLSEKLLASSAFGLGSGHRPEPGLPGYDGRGVTIALLDTGVDEAHPYLRGRILSGIDVVDRGPDARAHPDPQDPSQLERHGTELAGILVGGGGPGGLEGVAPGATVLPIRVAGWQPGVDGREAVYGRSDQLIAGLDRAVDPNGDGDTHDAVRVALVGVVEPYAAFTDGPEAQAVQGALDLNTVVVAPAGNDGAAGPLFGSVAGPAGAPGALAVGATDGRAELPHVRVVLRRGLQVIFDREVPLVGSVAPRRSLSLRVGEPAAGGRYFDAKGFSLVAGRAVVLPAGGSPEQTAVAASRAGASAVVLYGAALPPDGLRLTEEESAPVVVVPAAAAVELLASQRAGVDVGVAIGGVQEAANPAAGGVAGFSSRGLAFDTTVKPDVVAPGIAIATAAPGAAGDGSPLYATVNGTSAAAAQVAGAAAVLAQLRPDLDGLALRSLLVGYAAAGPPATTGGAGVFRLGASAVGEVAADAATLGFGIWAGPHWHATRAVVVRNVSTRPLQLSIDALAGADPEALRFTVVPDHLVLGPGRAAPVQVTVRAPAAPPVGVVTGDLRIAPLGGEPLELPWALSFDRAPPTLLSHLSLSESAFKPSDTRPAIMSVQVGSVSTQGGVQVQPVVRLDVLLYTAAGRFLGVLARLRDLLPGSYSFGITGRGPGSELLPPGGYELRLNAWPSIPKDAPPAGGKVRFTVE